MKWSTLEDGCAGSTSRWPSHKVAAEYDSGEWHVGADALRRDREKLAALQDLGWMVVPIVVDDVRRQPSVARECA